MSNSLISNVAGIRYSGDLFSRSHRTVHPRNTSTTAQSFNSKVPQPQVLVNSYMFGPRRSKSREACVVHANLDDANNSTRSVDTAGEVATSSSAANMTEWESRATVFEYTSAANPEMSPVPVLVHPPQLHQEGPSRVIPFDLSSYLGVQYPCTGPNLMASFVRVLTGETVSTDAAATSQAFYVIRGSGTSQTEDGEVSWSEGDLFAIPASRSPITHTAHEGDFGGAALYWVTDEPLLRYLGVAPVDRKFEPTMWRKERLLKEVANIASSTSATELNRLGVLLGNVACEQTKTLTHVLWSLLNSIAAGQVQRPHRHNSIALDLAVSAKPGVYTLMGQSLDSNGEIVDPIRCDWTPGGVFVTPPGWWHAHYNESDEIAWVLPMQDAGLYTNQRTLDIRFVDDELRNMEAGVNRGAAFEVTAEQYNRLASKVPEALRSELLP